MNTARRMEMGKLYYVLVIRQDKFSPWEIEFGDYVKSVVEQERRDLLDSLDLKRSNTKVVTIGGDTQAEIDAAVAALVRGEA
jgi:hypothetical protein